MVVGGIILYHVSLVVSFKNFHVRRRDYYSQTAVIIRYQN